MYSTLKDFFFNGRTVIWQLHRVGVTAWVVKCRTFHAVVYWMFIFFNILTVYDFMLELSKVLLNTSSKYTAVKMDNGISI